MKILTTNSSGIDTFGGIHTRLREHMKYSPEDSFYIVEPNTEKKYVPRDNKALIKLDVPNLLEDHTMLDSLKKSNTFLEFNQKVEPLVNEYQNAIQTVNPDLVVIPGSSLTSYFLFKAAKREKCLNRTIHSYAGVIEKELGGYHGEPRAILAKVGKSFTTQEVLENVTYVFPSNLVKRTLEEEHGIKFTNYHILPNGVSEELSNENTKRSPPSELTLGYIGRIHHVKNARFFLDLSDNLKEPAVLKTITDLRNISDKTDGPSLLDKLTKGEVFYYHPRTTEDLGKFYKTQVSAIVIPSLFETFCNVAIESVACGTPALLSDRAGATEIYKKYDLGNLIFSITDLESFHRALDSAKSLEFRVDDEIVNAIISDLSWKNVVEKFKKIAKNLVS